MRSSRDQANDSNTNEKKKEISILNVISFRLKFYEIQIHYNKTADNTYIGG